MDSDIICLLTLPQLYAEIFPSLGLSIIPPSNYEFEKLDNYKKQKYNRIINNIVIWLGYSLVLYHIDSITLFIILSIVVATNILQINHPNIISASTGFCIAITMIIALMMKHSIGIINCLYILFAGILCYIGIYKSAYDKITHTDEFFGGFFMSLGISTLISKLIGLHTIHNNAKPLSNMMINIHILTIGLISIKYIIELGNHYSNYLQPTISTELYNNY